MPNQGSNVQGRKCQQRENHDSLPDRRSHVNMVTRQARKGPVFMLGCWPLSGHTFLIRP